MVPRLGADVGPPGPSDEELGVMSVRIAVGWIRTLDRTPESQGVALPGPGLSGQQARRCAATLLVAPPRRGPSLRPAQGTHPRPSMSGPQCDSPLILSAGPPTTPCLSRDSICPGGCLSGPQHLA